MSFCRGRARFSAAVLKLLWASLLLGCCAAGVVARAWGQTSVDGAISGFVVDASEAALAGAVVEVQNVSTGLERWVTTGRGGEFMVTSLPPGEYEVIVEYARFDQLVLRGVVVELGVVTSLEARMRVGGVASSVTVTAKPPVAVSLEDVPSDAVASAITAGEIEQLPVNGRRWQTFALLTPETNSDPEGDGLLSFRGVASTQNSSRIDGADDDQSFGAVPRGTGSESEPEEESDSRSSGGMGHETAAGGGGYGRHSGAAYTFSQEAVREFRVSGQNYSAHE